jgi:hypothetical protein
MTDKRTDEEKIAADIAALENAAPGTIACHPDGRRFIVRRELGVTRLEPIRESRNQRRLNKKNFNKVPSHDAV